MGLAAGSSFAKVRCRQRSLTHVVGPTSRSSRDRHKHGIVSLSIIFPVRLRTRKSFLRRTSSRVGGEESQKAAIAWELLQSRT